LRAYRIGLLPGDGVGPEVIEEGVKALEAAASRFGFGLEWVRYPFGAEWYLERGELLPDSALEEMKGLDALYLGAIGDPRVPPGILERGILLKIRFHFDQYVNLRPIKLLPGVECPIKRGSEGPLEVYVVRENTEDLYVGLGGRRRPGSDRFLLPLERRLYRGEVEVSFKLDAPDEVAFQVGLISRRGAERVSRFAFELAKSKGKRKVTCVDKVNAMPHIYSLWRETFEEVGKDYPDIERDYAYVDAMTMWLVKSPESYQVILAPNMFGDIITDLGAVLQGGLGLAAGANLNPVGLSMFEPIHGSAPKHKGKGTINPMATILAGAMMLEFLGEADAAVAVERAVEAVLREGRVRTPDLGGSSTTSQVGDAVASALA